MALKAVSNGRYSTSVILNFYKSQHLNFKLILIALGIFFIAFALIFLPNYIFKQAPVAQSVNTKLKVTEVEILKIASKHPLAKEFMRENPLYKTKVTFLDETAIKSLVGTSPAIYANINSKEIYKVEYSSEKEGVMFLIDPTTKTVVNIFVSKK